MMAENLLKASRRITDAVIEASGTFMNLRGVQWQQRQRRQTRVQSATLMTSNQSNESLHFLIRCLGIANQTNGGCSAFQEGDCGAIVMIDIAIEGLVMSCLDTSR
jgi:hypothetical protein